MLYLANLAAARLSTLRHRADDGRHHGQKPYWRERSDRTTSGKHHYVSKFHLSEFCEPTSLSSRDPWLWIGRIKTGEVKRRSPKNVGTVSAMFDGPGGLADRNSTLESFLGANVEGPAANALRKLASGQTNLPAELMRYLAWAAARSLPMQREYANWAREFGATDDFVEPPPRFLQKEFHSNRDVRLVHFTTREQRTVDSGDVEGLFDAGWVPDFSQQSNFLECVHIQAAYFQERWFPRLRWFSLRPPVGEFFIIGDRPVGWGVPDCINAPPCCLRDESAFLIAPLTCRLALVGRNSTDPWNVTAAAVNGILAAWSHEWIAGPTPAVVQNALQARSELS